MTSAAGGVVAVAVSGGRDSMSLLHCTARAAAVLGLDVIALHVHHGLQQDADAWAEVVENASARWSVRFAMQCLSGRPAKGDSVEAWARKGRYLALAAMARQAGAGIVLLAHHRRDQAETFLVQALRGGGPAGLAAMPGVVERGRIVWARPWLAQPQQAIEAYARRHRLRFVADPSNADPRFTRSRLRTLVLPALSQAFPGADALLAQAAARNAEAQVLLDEVAQADLANLTDGPALRLVPWRALSLARQRNALRAWLRQTLGRGPPQSLLERLMKELPGTGAAQWTAEGSTLRRYRGRLLAGPPDDRADPAASLPQDAQIKDAGLHAVAGQGARLRVIAVDQGGIAQATLRGAQWRQRRGGETFQRAAGTPARSLKKQFQAAGVPAWQRAAPLLFSADGRLLFVPGLGIDARAIAAPGEMQVTLVWERHA